MYYPCQVSIMLGRNKFDLGASHSVIGNTGNSSLTMKSKQKRRRLITIVMVGSVVVLLAVVSLVVSLLPRLLLTIDTILSGACVGTNDGHVSEYVVSWAFRILFSFNSTINKEVISAYQYVRLHVQ